MSAVFQTTVEGLAGLDVVKGLPEQVVSNAVKAINKTTDRARTAGARAIRQQVAFPASYLNPSGGRLSVARYASDDRLEASITARDRPTSLMRFALGNPIPGAARRGGINVEVKPGSTQNLAKAFVMKLRAGTADIDTKFNLGIAIRLKPGETIQNKREMVSLGGGLYLLYGPSVAQVFKTVAGDIAPDTAEFLENEFVRLMNLSGTKQ